MLRRLKSPLSIIITFLYVLTLSIFPLGETTIIKAYAEELSDTDDIIIESDTDDSYVEEIHMEDVENSDTPGSLKLDSDESWSDYFTDFQFVDELDYSIPNPIDFTNNYESENFSTNEEDEIRNLYDDVLIEDNITEDQTNNVEPFVQENNGDINVPHDEEANHRYALVASGAILFSPSDSSLELGSFSTEELVYVKSNSKDHGMYDVMFDTIETCDGYEPINGVMMDENLYFVEDNYFNIDNYEKCRCVDGYYIPLVANYVADEKNIQEQDALESILDNSSLKTDITDLTSSKIVQMETPCEKVINNDLNNISLSVTRDGISSVRLVWSEIENADVYELFRKIDNGLWKKVKNINTNYTSNLNLETGHFYYYKVRARFDDGTFSDFSYEGSINFSNNLQAPEIIAIEKFGTSSAKVTWKPVESVAEYIIYRSINNGSWTKLKAVNECYIINYGLNNNDYYSYKIIARNGEEYSDFSEEYEFTLQKKIESPIIRVSQYGMNTASIEWGKLDGAVEYNIYRSLDGRNWNFLKSTKESASLNYSLKEENIYFYKVSALYENGGSMIESDFSNTVEFQIGAGIEIPKNIVVARVSNTCAEISWDSVDNATGYSLYRSEDNISWKKIKDIEGTSTRNYSLVLGTVYSYKVRAYKSNDSTKAYGLASENVKYWNSEIIQLSLDNSDNSNHISWNSVSGADSYNIYVDNKLCESITNVEYTFSDNLTGECYVTACRTFGDDYIETTKSNIVLIDTIIKINYRALLIGETAYSQRLNGPDNDLTAMNNILTGLNMGYEIYSQLNATKEEIIDLIDIAFEDATNNDVSLFYYSGHGITGSGDYYAGAIQTIDYQYITTQDLAELLSNVPGKVIVIMDSCGSGATISDEIVSVNSLISQNNILTIDNDESSDNNIDDVFDAERFTEGIIEAFQAYNSYSSSSNRPNGPRKSKELATSKFYVLTGSAYEELSLTTYSDGIWGGLLTKGISSCVGFSYPSASFSGIFNGDSDGDKRISLSECAIYCDSYVDGRQHVLSYPSDSTFTMFFEGESD